MWSIQCSCWCLCLTPIHNALGFWLSLTFSIFTLLHGNACSLLLLCYALNISGLWLWMACVSDSMTTAACSMPLAFAWAWWLPVLCSCLVCPMPLLCMLRLLVLWLVFVPHAGAPCIKIPVFPPFQQGLHIFPIGSSEFWHCSALSVWRLVGCWHCPSTSQLTHTHMATQCFPYQ